MSQTLERRKDYPKLGQAITDIEVLKTSVVNIEDNLEKGFKNTNEMVRSFKNDIKDMYQELKRDTAQDLMKAYLALKKDIDAVDGDVEAHKKDDQLIKDKVVALESRQKNLKWVFMACAFGVDLGSKGLEAAARMLFGG